MACSPSTDAPDHRAVDRGRACVARPTAGALRRVSQHPPEIARAERGKPYSPALAGIDFNLSHARDHVLIAIARDQPLGVDLERVDRTLEIDDLARRLFRAAKPTHWKRCPKRQRRGGFPASVDLQGSGVEGDRRGLSFGLDRVAFDARCRRHADRMPMALAPEAGPRRRMARRAARTGGRLSRRARLARSAAAHPDLPRRAARRLTPNPGRRSDSHGFVKRRAVRRHSGPASVLQTYVQTRLPLRCGNGLCGSRFASEPCSRLPRWARSSSRSTRLRESQVRRLADALAPSVRLGYSDVSGALDGRVMLESPRVEILTGPARGAVLRAQRATIESSRHVLAAASGRSAAIPACRPAWTFACAAHRSRKRPSIITPAKAGSARRASCHSKVSAASRWPRSPRATTRAWASRRASARMSSATATTPPATCCAPTSTRPHRRSRRSRRIWNCPPSSRLHGSAICARRRRNASSSFL